MSTRNRALFFSDLGPSVGDFGHQLRKRGFDIEVVNSDGCKECLRTNLVEHKVLSDVEDSIALAQFEADFLAGRFCNGVIITDCAFSLSTESFDVNMKLR
jgi:hypothetical protein